MDIRQTIEDRGFVIIQGVDLQDPDQSLTDVVSSFATSTSYFGQPLIMDIKPKPGYQPVSSGGTAWFELHTDLTFHPNPPRYIAMLCIRNDDAGGGTPIIGDAVQSLEEIDEDAREMLRTHAVEFPCPKHVDGPPVIGAIVTQSNSQTRIRYRYDLTEHAPEAVRKFYDRLRINAKEMEISPGTVMIIDNHRMLHGRTEILGGMASNRLFKRMYGNP